MLWMRFFDDDSLDDVLSALQQKLFEPLGTEGHPSLGMGVDEQRIAVNRVIQVVDSMNYIVCV